MSTTKKIICSFALFTILLNLLSCGDDGKKHVDSPLKKEALAIADSLKSPEDFQRYIDMYKGMGDKDAELAIRMVYGKRLRNTSKFDAAVCQHDTCIKMAKEINDTVEIVNALNHQGTNYRRKGAIGEAINLHYEALNYCEKYSDDTSFIAQKNYTRTLNGLGNIYLSLENYEDAERMFRRGLSYENVARNPIGIAINLANIGSVKEHYHEVDSAFMYYKQSLEYNVSAKDSVGICLCYTYLGKLEEKYKKDKGDALKYYKKSYEIGRQTGDNWHWLEPCISIGNYYLYEHKLDSAQKYLEKALDTAYKISSIEHLARLHELFATLHEYEGNYLQSIRDIHICRLFNDSLALDKNQKALQNIRVEYEANKVREAENKIKTEKRINNLILIGGGIISVIVAIAFALLFRLIKISKKAAQEKEKAAQERQEFYRGVTHQLRTPLTVVLGMTQQLRKFLPENDPLAKREFDAVNRQCQQLLNLVTEMIEFSKNGSVSKAPIISEINLNPDTEVDIPSNMTSEDEGRYILLAEDDPDVALLITEMLKAKGYSYAWAKDGQEAWEMMHDNMPELLITDIMMPRMDGLELMKKVRNDESINHLPIIVVSARVENEDRLIGFEAGAEVYLGKPFLPNELLIRVRKLLEQRRILQNRFLVRIGQTEKENSKPYTPSQTTPEPDVPTNDSPVISTTDEVVEVTEETVIQDTSTKVVYSETEDNVEESNQQEPRQDTMSNKERLFLESVDSYIMKNLSNPDLSSASLADGLNTTTSTLNRKLKNLTNIDTTHYIRMHRIAKAKDLLENSELTMMEIQIECGFDTPSYFSRTFKADVGVSPSEYKKNIS